MLEIFASGLVGALLATLLGALFSFLQEQARLRAEVMLDVVSWADDAYIRTIDLHQSKDAAYTSDKPYLSPEEYDANSRELRSMLLRGSVLARLAIVYGEGEETSLLNQIRSNLLKAVRMLWQAKKETWQQVDPAVHALLEQNVDPLRKKLERQLLEKASLPLISVRLRRRVVERLGLSDVIGEKD